MRVLTLRWPAASGPDLRSTIRELALRRAPAVDGLLSRHFKLERGAILGRYVFDGFGDLDRLAGDPNIDPAVAKLRRYALSVPPAATVEDAAEVDVFDRPLFIVSAPKGGGTLLYDLLARSHHVWTIDGDGNHIIEGVPELHPMTRGWTSHRLTDLDADPLPVQALKGSLVAELCDHDHRRFLELPVRRRPLSVRLIERTPENALRVSFLAAAFPEAQFVFVYRDARQNVSSLIEAWRHDDVASIPLLPGWRRGAWHLLLPEGWREQNDAPLVDVAALQWATANQQALDDLELLAHDRWISIDYAEIIAAPCAVVDRVVAFGELEVKDAFGRVFDGASPLFGSNPPSPINWRNNSEFHESALVRYTWLRARLRELGGPSAPPPAAPQTNPKLRFACFVDQTPVPPVTLGEEWIVNPTFHLQLGATVPLVLVSRARFRERFLADFPLAWVEDAVTGVLHPFWLQRNYAHLLRGFVAGRPPPPLSDALAAELAAAHVVVTRAEFDRLRRDGDALVNRARAHFEVQRYCHLPSLIHPTHVAALGRYYDALIEDGDWALGDAQVQRRYSWHNESVSRYFHHQLTAFIGRVAGEPVRPSYCFVSAYRAGAVLKPHVDRKQCEFTVSLWVGGGAAPDGEPWPLWLHSPDGVVSLTQSAGDGVLFRGCELPHWRGRPRSGTAGTTLICHYVPRDFTGVID